MTFPPYAYVPGHWPHPTRDPSGHGFDREPAVAVALEPARWRSNATWIEGLELFDHGYYWEAHEAWERLWIAAGRAGPIGELLSGLIKLAAAGVKIRQGKGPEAARLGAKALECFARARLGCGTASLAGLGFALLEALGREATSVESTESIEASGGEQVMIVFSGRLLEVGTGDGVP